MNYYAARPRADGSGFHYTVRNDDRIWAVGYCAEHSPHATVEEAQECFRRYLLDDPREESYADWAGCVVCDAPTKEGLRTRYPLGYGFAFCDEHRTVEQLEVRVPSVDTVAASY